jgi:hypothetical protein
VPGAGRAIEQVAVPPADSVFVPHDDVTPPKLTEPVAAAPPVSAVAVAVTLIVGFAPAVTDGVPRLTLAGAFETVNDVDAAGEVAV